MAKLVLDGRPSGGSGGGGLTVTANPIGSEFIMGLLISTTRQHLPRRDVDAMIAERYGSGVEITDSAALTFASWWQTPGGRGAAFAQLASTGTVDYHSLQAAIAAEYPEATARTRDGPCA